MLTIDEINNININELTGPLKRIALFHDISGFGKASITVSLPILATAGIEGVCVPTALLSTHTGDFKNFTYLDLTDEIPKILDHWLSFSLTFNAIYSGYLSSTRQVDILIDFINKQKGLNTDLIVFVDPVMGDNGILYSAYEKELINKNKELIKQANIIFPNMTESYFLLDLPYQAGPYNKEEIKTVAKKLQEFSQANIVITGIEMINNQIGIAILENNQFDLILNPKLEGKFHGTGDIFASF